MAHPATSACLLPFYPTHLTHLTHATHCAAGGWQARSYHMNLKPTRPVRGARMAVGCWNAVPVLKLIVSAA